MPYKRRYGGATGTSSKRRRVARVARRVFRRRMRRRNFRRFRRSNQIHSKFSYGIGPRKVVNMRWYAMSNLSVSSSSLTWGTPIVVNSAYDPWSSITGTFNLVSGGYTLYSKLYNNYVVLGAKLTTQIRNRTVRNVQDITLVSGSGTSTNVTMTQPSDKWGVWLDDDMDTSGFTGWHMIASAGGAYKTITPSFDGKGKSSIKVYYSARKMWNVKDPSGDDKIYCSMGSGPSGTRSSIRSPSGTRTAYATPWVQSSDETSRAYSNQYELHYVLRMSVLCFNPTDWTDMTDTLLEK